MTEQQLTILNSLITYAAENIPGGLSDDESEVAQIVGDWVLRGAVKTHDYKIVNSTHGPSMEFVVNQWAEHGWRVVAVVSDTRPGYAHSLVLERSIGIIHPDD